jgi:hypothetical protein
MASNNGFALERITVSIENSHTYRGTEIVADLRNISETFFHPFQSVGFWEEKSGEHLCRSLLKGESCTHDSTSNGLNEYRKFLEDRHNAILEIYFPHAGMEIFLA